MYVVRKVGRKGTDMRENVRCEIYCQKGKSYYPEIPLNSEGWEEEGLYVEMAEHMGQVFWLEFYCFNEEIYCIKYSSSKILFIF